MTVQVFRSRTTKFYSRGDHSFYDTIKEIKRFRSSTLAFTATSTEFGDGSPTIRDYLAKKGKLDISPTPLTTLAD